MGWTSYDATHYKHNGKVDAKAELDDRFSQDKSERVNSKGEIEKYPQIRVLKSSMVGTVYYGAIEVTYDDSRDVWGMVALTSTSKSDGFNFSYKDMDETCIPYCFDCPKSILDLLTPTESKNANEWRNKCRQQLQLKREHKTLGTLPVGSVITFKRHNGKEITLEKHSPAYQFKRPFWYDGEHYWKRGHIPSNFEIVRMGDA